MCVFDSIGGVHSNVLQLDVPAGPPWAARGGSGSFGYSDRTGANSGVEKIRIKQNKRGKGRFLLIGKGANLPLPGPFDLDSYLADDPETVLQIENGAGSCWTEEVGPPIRNDSERFKAKR